MCPNATYKIYAFGHDFFGGSNIIIDSLLGSGKWVAFFKRFAKSTNYRNAIPGYLFGVTKATPPLVWSMGALNKPGKKRIRVAMCPSNMNVLTPKKCGKRV